MMTAKFGILDRMTYESRGAARTAPGVTLQIGPVMPSHSTPLTNSRKIEMMTFACLTCGGSFTITARRARQRAKQNGRGPEYCSRHCLNTRKRDTKITLTCEQCGNNFEDYKSNINRRNHEVKYCSRKCYKAAMDVSEERTCLTCNEAFLVGTKRSSRTKKYCSRKCAEAGDYRFRNRTRVTCEYCGERFYRTPAFIRGRIFCDNECWAKNRTKEFNQNAVKPCAWCGETLERRKGEGGANFARRMTCSKECAGKYRWRTNPNPAHLYTKEFTTRVRHEVRLRDMFSCQECGVMEDGQQHDVHHIDYDKHNNHPTNLITLCRSCHSKTSSVGRKRRRQWVDYYQARMKERMKTMA